jgi:hypothetical protein
LVAVSFNASESGTVVGGNCEAFCYLAKKACPLTFGVEYPDDDCVDDCSTFPGADGNYNVKLAKAGGNNLQCRTLYVSRALEALDPGAKSDGKDCPAVFGIETCTDD